MAPEKCAVLVLGAGIAGTSLAYHLARRNVGRIVVFDPRTPAAGATGRAAGIVTEQLWDRWDVQVTRDSREEYQALARRRDASLFTANGFARWTAKPAAAEALRRARERLRGWGVRAQEARPQDLERWIPGGRFDDVIEALYGPDDAIVTPGALAEAYVEEARALGVEFHVGTPWRSFTLGANGAVLDTGPGLFEAGAAVVAAGAWSKRILAELAHPLPLVPYRTQAAILRPPEPPVGPFASGHDLDTDVYLRPEGPGRILAGDGTERVEADPDRFASRGDERFVAHLAQTFGSRFPRWSESEMVAAWAGVCTATPDRRPLVGPVPQAPGLYVMAGFNGFGVMRAGGIARRLADRIADGPGGRAEEALASVDPGRFANLPSSFLPQPGFTLEGGDEPRY